MSRILPTIVIAQFFCTSLWFAGNATINDIAAQLSITDNFLAHLSSAVQLGFIAGTLLFALLSIADRFSPSKVFFVCAIIAAAFNIGITIDQLSPAMVLVFRLLTGFFLAGIYPVGMKIASDYYRQGLGKSLGFLVGALVLGTAFPHLLKTLTMALPWKLVLYGTSILSIAGGLAILLLVPDGPFRRAGQKPDINAFLQGFRNNKFRAAALGYFGHMWELYAFWVFVPVLLSSYQTIHGTNHLNIPLLSFLVIASGSIACAIGGYFSNAIGSKKLATIALGISGTCCLLSPLFILQSSSILLILFLFIWGMAVIADSPLFSTLVAQNAPETARGASLTIVNCIGFSITIVSIQLINGLKDLVRPEFLYLFLSIGPVLGLLALFRKDK